MEVAEAIGGKRFMTFHGRRKTGIRGTLTGHIKDHVWWIDCMGFVIPCHEDELEVTKRAAAAGTAAAE